MEDNDVKRLARWLRDRYEENGELALRDDQQPDQFAQMELITGGDEARLEALSARIEECVILARAPPDDADEVGDSSFDEFGWDESSEDVDPPPMPNPQDAEGKFRMLRW
jgi:hypothetical protein